MARYLAVAGVQREGRLIGALDHARGSDPARVAPSIPDGARLVAVVSNGSWKSAVDVSHPFFFQALQSRVAGGVWREAQLYLLDDELARRFEDGKRALMDGHPVRDPGRTSR